jgi:hypothetical protein
VILYMGKLHLSEALGFVARNGNRIERDRLLLATVDGQEWRRVEK